MNRNVIAVIGTLLLFGSIFGKDNRISLTLGEPDLIGIEYQRNINNFYVAFSPHVLSSLLICYILSYRCDLAIFPNLSFGYNFYKKGKFELASDLIITPAYFEETYQDSIHTKYYELWIGPRIIPSLTFSKITLSLCAGFFFIYDFKETRYNEIKPSIAIKAGYNF